MAIHRKSGEVKSTVQPKEILAFFESDNSGKSSDGDIEFTPDGTCVNTI